MATKKKAKRGRASVSAKRYLQLDELYRRTCDAFTRVYRLFGIVTRESQGLTAERDALAKENSKLRRKLGRLEGKGKR